MTYNETILLTASVETPCEGVAYAYEWRRGDEKVQDGAELSVKAESVGVFEYKVVVTASAEWMNDATAERTIAVTVNKAVAQIEVARDTIMRTWTGNGYSGFASEIDARIADEEITGTLSYSLYGEEFTDETTLTDGGTYAVQVVLTSDNYVSDKVVYIKITSVKANGITYTLEDALALGGDIVIFGNTVVNADLRIPKGSTVTLPYDGSEDATKVNAGGLTEGGRIYYIDNDERYLKRTLTVAKGAKLTVEGELKVGGITGADDMHSYQGSTSGDYAQINVDEDAEIIVTNGTLNNYGYIKGEGKLTAKRGGTVITPFVVRDYQGGSSTGGKYEDGHISPISQYEMPNIQILQRYEAGAVLKAHASLYTGETSFLGATLPASYNKTDANIIGEDVGLILLKDGYIEIRTVSTFDEEETELYKRYATHTDLDIYGNAEMGAMELTISVTISSITVNTSTIPFPLPYNYAVTQKSGTLKVPYAYKLLPGSSFTIEAGATVTLEGENASLAVYDNGWQDQNPFGTQAYPHDLGEAVLTVKGELRVLSGAIGGDIKTQGSGKVTISEGVRKSVTVQEGYGSRESGTMTFHFEPCDRSFFPHTYTATLNGEPL